MDLTTMVLALSCIVILAASWTWRRSVFLLPSTWILILSSIIYLVPAAIFSEDVQDMSPFAWKALRYCVLFVDSGLLINLLLVRAPERSTVLPQGVTGDLSDKPGSTKLTTPLVLLLTILACITAWYLFNVPLRSTGMYGVLFDPENAAQMREQSLKLLTNPALQYLYLVGFTCLSPLTLAILLARSSGLSAARRWLLMGATLGFLAFYLLLTGARIGLVNLMAAGVFYGFLRRDLRINVRVLVISILVMVAVPVAISILREQGRNDATVIEYVEAIAARVFLLPLLISGWFVEYADTHNPVGLMQALGLGEHINWTNFIALEYLGRKEEVTIESVTTPTAFFFSNYLYFGWLGLVPSLLALRFIDLPMQQLHRIPQHLRLPFAATILFFSVVFVQSGFGVTLLSHGYILLTALVFALRRRTLVSKPLGARV